MWGGAPRRLITSFGQPAVKGQAWAPSRYSPTGALRMRILSVLGRKRSMRTFLSGLTYCVFGSYQCVRALCYAHPPGPACGCLSGLVGSKGTLLLWEPASREPEPPITLPRRDSEW
jgi:hypothetical protein